MTTLELTQTQVTDNLMQHETRQFRVVNAARSVGSWLVDRLSGSEYPAGKATTVPTFDSVHMNEQDYSDWFSNNEYAFGD